MTTSSSKIHYADHLDVREIPPRDKHASIFRLWSGLSVGSHFVLVNDHDPVPLYYQFSAEHAGAFEWEYLERGPDVYRVKITRLQTSPGHEPELPLENARVAVVTTEAPAGKTQEIDVRGLEPPEPLVRILSTLASLPVDTTLRARTDREPCHLFGEAGQRGFSHHCNEQSDGSWVTTLTRL